MTSYLVKTTSAPDEKLAQTRTQQEINSWVLFATGTGTLSHETSLISRTSEVLIIIYRVPSSTFCLHCWFFPLQSFKIKHLKKRGTNHSHCRQARTKTKTIYVSCVAGDTQGDYDLDCDMQSE